MNTFSILWPNPEDVQLASDQFAKYKLSDGIDALDAVTAAIAVRHKLPIVTLNVKHFRAIPGVSVVQAYTR